LSVRICVLGSGSKGNSTLVATERTRLLVDAGFSKKDTFRRLAEAGERTDNFDALLISHEHVDHINGLKSLAIALKVPIYITGPTRAVIQWDPRLKAFETISAGGKFTIGDFEIAPFSIPHDAVDPVAFTLTKVSKSASLLISVIFRNSSSNTRLAATAWCLSQTTISTCSRQGRIRGSSSSG
jgi:phosphoribosyl 1,2-cyclic phosphodiesterase